MGLPEIRVEFKKLASTARIRSARGILALVLQDETGGFDSARYGALEEVNRDDYTEENYKAIEMAFEAGPYQLVTVCIGTSGTMEDAKGLLNTLHYNWVCSPVAGLQSGLVAFVKETNTAARMRKVKAVVTGVTGADDMHVVNCVNASVTRKGGEVVQMADYLPRIGGVLAACPMTESVTYKAFDDLEDVAPVSNIDQSINAGNLVLFLDDDTVRIGRGVNTLQTITGDLTEEQKKIVVVEAMDLIQEDIIRNFKANYLGRVKNTADNQALFVSDILGYLHELAQEDIVDREQPITMGVDVPAMRKAWAGAGVDVAELKDNQVQKKTFRSAVFIAGSVRILDAMEDLHLVCALQ